MANLSFQTVSGQDLAENGPFAFKPHKEFIKKNTVFILENLMSKTVNMLQTGRFQLQIGEFSFQTANLAAQWPILVLVQEEIVGGKTWRHERFKKKGCMASMDRVPWAGGMKQPRESKPEKNISVKQSVRP